MYNQYVMWFARYGNLHAVSCTGPIEDIVDWVAEMDQEDIRDYDEHGIPEALERAGSGIVEGFWDLVNARREAMTQERKQRAEEYSRRLAERKESGEQMYRILLKPPDGVGGNHLGRRPVAIRLGLTHDAVIKQRDELEALYGCDRIVVELNR